MKPIRKYLLLFYCLIMGCANVAHQHMAKGRDYFDRGLFEESISEYNNAIRADGSLKKEGHFEILKSYNEISMGLIQKKRYEDALREFYKARNLIGWKALSRKNRALAYAGLGNEFVDEKKYVEAIKNFRRSLALQSNLLLAKKGIVNAYNSLAMRTAAVETMDSLQKSMSYLDKAEAIFKNSGDTRRKRALVLYKMGIVLLKQKKSREAVLKFEESKNLDPKFAKLARGYLSTAHNNRGVALLKEKDFNGAISEFESALVLNPNTNMGNENLATAHLNMGINFLEKRSYMNALSEFDKALKLRPDFMKAIEAKSLVYNNRGVDTLEAGNVSEAIALLDKAVLLSPQSKSANRNLAVAHNTNGNKYIDKKDFESALVEFKLAVRYKANFGEAHGNMALVFAKLGKFKKAWEALKKAEDSGFAVESVKVSLAEMERK